MRLIINDFEETVKKLASKAISIKVMIAFLTRDGIRWIPTDKLSQTEFIVGVDLQITSKEVLTYLMDQKADISIFHEKGKMFHPKVIHIITEEEQEYLILGSNNLTASGISSNHEVSVCLTRTEHTDTVFGDFLAHFSFLKKHPCCGVPDQNFFDTYRQQDVSRVLNAKQLNDFRVSFLPREDVNSDSNRHDVQSIREFLQELSTKFPALDRSREKIPIKNHPLKKLNDNSFRPLFADIIKKATNGRLEATANLNISGNWYRIPNIFAVNEHEHAEPYERTKSHGRLVVQVHFTTDYKRVFFSSVLQFNAPLTFKKGEMPPSVSARYVKLLEHARSYSDGAILDLPVFHHWDYKQQRLWGKPIISFEYPVEKLPNDSVLLSHIEYLARYVNASTAIY